jgi:hypothetical protein
VRTVKATLVAVALASAMVWADSVIPNIDPCDYLDNAFLRWLYDCPPLDSGAG